MKITLSRQDLPYLTLLFLFVGSLALMATGCGAPTPTTQSSASATQPTTAVLATAPPSSPTAPPPSSTASPVLPTPSPLPSATLKPLPTATRTPLPGAPNPLLTVPIQAIRLSDDDGGRTAKVDSEDIAQWVDFANDVFSVAGIMFQFNPERDFSELQSSLLNKMDMTDDPNWEEEKQAGNEVAARFPDKITVLFRYGRYGEADRGFASREWDFVTMTGFWPHFHCGRQNIESLAHEFGHYLGLAHTFPRTGYKSVAEAENYFKANGNNPAAFDGDGLRDTPPDPSILANHCNTRITRVTLQGVEFVLPRDNLMSYYTEARKLTLQQIQRVRLVFETREKSQMLLTPKR